jgi:cholesterol transport system auxiliary component
MSLPFFSKPEVKSINAMNSIAAYAGFTWAGSAFYSIAAALVLSACSALPSKPTRATIYDFGPGPLAARPVQPVALQTPQTPQTPLAPVAIEDISTSGGPLDNMAVLYRLAYVDAQELRPYSQSRWSMPPAQLVRQRLRDTLSLRRPVFNAREGLALNRSQNPLLPLQLRLELQEFSHYFSAPDASVGLVRLRATLVDVTAAGEKLVAQRIIVAQKPATTADAPGGVRALTAATDAVIDELDQWLQQQAPRQTTP